MPFGQIEDRNLQGVRNLITGFTDRYLRNEMARQQAERDRLDREAANRVVNTWAEAIKPTDKGVPTADQVYAGMGQALNVAGPNAGPRTRAAVGDVHNQATLYPGFHPQPRIDTSVTPYEDWRRQRPVRTVDDWLNENTDQSIRKTQEGKPEIYRWVTKNVNGVNILMPQYGYLRKDGTYRQVDVKGFSPQPNANGPAGGPPLAKDVEKYRDRYLTANEVVGQVEDYYGKDMLTQWRGELTADPDYAAMMRTPEGQWDLAFQGMDKTKATKIKALLAYERALSTKESAGRLLNGLSYAVDTDTGELRRVNPAGLKKSNPGRPKEPGAQPPPAQTLSAEDQEAITWAKANRGNPDAEQILKIHGIK